MLPVTLVAMVPRVPQVRKALPAFKGSLASRVQLVHRASQEPVQLEFRGSLALLELLASKVRQDLKVPLVLPGLKARQVCKVPRVQTERPEFKALRG